MSLNKTIGILGGGQLAKMLAIAAANLGFNINIYCPDRDCPAAQVANKIVFGNYDENETLLAFARSLSFTFSVHCSSIPSGIMTGIL